MTSTIGEFINLFEKDQIDGNVVNVSIEYPMYWSSHFNGLSLNHVNVNQDQDWDYIVFKQGHCSVKDFVTFLKTLTQFKNRFVALYSGKCGEIDVATSKLTVSKVLSIDFSEKPEHIPKFADHFRNTQFEKFESELKNLKDLISDPNYSFIPFAQSFAVQNPVVKPIYCVGNTFYKSLSKIQKDFPGTKLEDGLFEEKHGVLVTLKEFKDETLFVADGSEYTRQELLDKFTLTEIQIDKLFEEENGKMQCKLSGFLQTFSK